jgi:hypothetical protein
MIIAHMGGRVWAVIAHVFDGKGVFMVQRCKRFTSHFFTVILSVVLLAGLGGEAYGSGPGDHAEKGHDRSEIARDNVKRKEVRLQGNVKNINARKTKFELCSTTECTKVKVTRKTSFTDVNRRASKFANLVENDYVTVTGRVRDKHHDKGRRHHNRDDSPQTTVKADVVEIGNITRYKIINGVTMDINPLPSICSCSSSRVLDILDRSTWAKTCVTVPHNADILLVTDTGSEAIVFENLLFRQDVEVHGNYDDTSCFSAQTVLATP